MNRRIIAALMALMILFCALPVSAAETAEDYADCRIYERGTIYEPDEKVWVVGRGAGNAPLDEDAGDGYHWEQYKYIWRPGCLMEEHPRHEDECWGYVDGVWSLLCELEIHIHNMECNVFGAHYLYHVVSDNPPITDPIDPPITDPPDIDPDDPPQTPDTPTTKKSGFEDDSGDIYLIVQSVTAAGEPLQNVSFRLVREKTDEDGNVIINSETGLPDLEPVAEDILWTNSEGQVRFNALETYIDDFDQPWLVVQEADAFRSGGEYYDVYYCNDSQWNVVTDDGAVRVTLAKNCGVLEREPQTVAEGYSGGVLTFVNDRIRSTLDISVEFEGITANVAAEGSFGITVSREPDDDEFPKTVTFPTSESTRNYSWGTSLEDLSSGTYTLNAEEPEEIADYKHISTVIELLNEEKGKWEETNCATLGTDNALATFRVTYTYEADNTPPTPPDPKDDPTNTINIVTVDDLKHSISGAEYLLTDDLDGSQWMYNEEIGYRLEDLAGVENAGMTYTLVQSKAPAGYHLCTDVYTVEISDEGNVTLRKKDAAEGEGVGWSEEGWQIAQFENRRKSATIALTCEAVTANVDEACWNVEQTKAEFEGRAHTFRLTWDGNSTGEELTLKAGESGAFKAQLPLGTKYQVEALDDENFECDIVEKAIGRTRASGTVMAYQTTGDPVEMAASINYTIVPDTSDLTVTMRRVDRADSITPLEGAKFVLKDEKGKELKSYVTQKDGYIILEEVINAPGKTFVLTEETAPAGYAKVEGDIKIYVGLEYARPTDSVGVLKQVLKETVTHDAVIQTPNGHYSIRTLSLADANYKANTIILRTEDKQGKELQGAEYTLTNGNQTRIINAQTGYILDDLLEYAAGADAKYTLEQTKKPDGYNLAKEKYTVEVSQKDVTVTLKKANTSAVIGEGSQGEQVAKFVSSNSEETAKIKITCDSVTANVDDRCWDKVKTQKEFESKAHNFHLFVKDSNGAWNEVEVLTLAKGKSDVFQTKLAYGTEYKVTPDNNGGFACTITNSTGVVGDAQMGTTLDLHARITYTIKRGDSWHDVYLRKVSYRGKKPLSDAKFVLRDEYDDTIETYITKDDGHIDIEGVFNEPGRTYSLKEAKAPEGYIKLNRPIEIEIVVGYERSAEGGVLNQVLTERISHEEVELTADGTYIIINKTESDIPQTGDTMNPVLWGSMAVLSLMAAAVLVLGKKRFGMGK